MRIKWLSVLLSIPLLLSVSGCGERQGGKVAFVKEVGPGQPAIFSLDLRSGQERLLTKGEERCTAPNWSPDGKHIVFAARVPASEPSERRTSFTSNIYAMNANGMNLRDLTESNVEHNYKTPSWSPDGSSVLFVDAGNGVYIMSPDRADTKQVANSGRNPAWSADGEKIAFDTSDGYVYIVNVDGTELRSIVKGREPDWSPDGTKVVFAGQDGDIYVIGADGRGRVRLTNDEYLDRWPVWSPDGTKILYSSARPSGASFSFYMYIVDAEGSGRTEIGEGKEPDWW